PRSSFVQRHGSAGDPFNATDTGTDQHARFGLLVVGLRMPTSIVERLSCRTHRKDDELVDLALFFRLHPLIGIVTGAGPVAARDDTGDLAGNVGHVESVDLLRPAFALEQPRPCSFDAATERCKHPHPSDDDTSHGRLRTNLLPSLHCVQPIKPMTNGAIEQLPGARSTLGVLFQKFDGVANGKNGLGSIIGNLAPEFLFEGHHELDGVETVGAKIIDKAGLIIHLVGLYAQMLHDDLFHPLANVTHRSNLVLIRLGCEPGLVRNHHGPTSSWSTVMRRSPIAEYYSAASRPSRAESRLPYFKSID